MMHRSHPLIFGNAVRDILIGLEERSFPASGFAITDCSLEGEVTRLRIIFRNSHGRVEKDLRLKPGEDGLLGENEIYDELLCQKIDEYFLETYELFVQTILRRAAKRALKVAVG